MGKSWIFFPLEPLFYQSISILIELSFRGFYCDEFPLEYPFNSHSSVMQINPVHNKRISPHPSTGLHTRTTKYVVRISVSQLHEQKKLKTKMKQNCDIQMNVETNVRWKEMP